MTETGNKSKRTGSEIETFKIFGVGIGTELLFTKRKIVTPNQNLYILEIKSQNPSGISI